MSLEIYNGKNLKRVASPDYNYDFYRSDGTFLRWGATVNDDPQTAPGPEIADIEISVGDCSGRCPWCYKSNRPGDGRHMSLETFKAVLDRLNQWGGLTQVALGLTDVNANPDLLSILSYCQLQGVVPNFTLAGFGLTDEIARACSWLCGAVAVSCYPHTKDLCYDTIKRLTDLGMKQVNMHLLYHAGNFDFVKQVLANIVDDPRLSGLNAVVLLGLKQAGRGTTMQTLDWDHFERIIKMCRGLGIRYGMDSCSATKFLQYLDLNVEDDEERECYKQMVEPCESGLFSIYVDVDGNVWPCSFTEGLENWEQTNLLLIDDFNHVWYSQQMRDWRKKLLANGRACPCYNV